MLRDMDRLQYCIYTSSGWQVDPIPHIYERLLLQDVVYHVIKSSINKWDRHWQLPVSPIGATYLWLVTVFTSPCTPATVQLGNWSTIPTTTPRLLAPWRRWPNPTGTAPMEGGGDGDGGRSRAEAIMRELERLRAEREELDGRIRLLESQLRLGAAPLPPSAAAEVEPTGSPSSSSSAAADMISRYRRHLLLPQFGLEGSSSASSLVAWLLACTTTVHPLVVISGQRKLSQSSILVVGAGGLGSPVAMYLAACGVGKSEFPFFYHPKHCSNLTWKNYCDFLYNKSCSSGINYRTSSFGKNVSSPEEQIFLLRMRWYLLWLIVHGLIYYLVYFVRLLRYCWWRSSWTWQPASSGTRYLSPIFSCTFF